MSAPRIYMLAKNLGGITTKSKLANIRAIRTFSIFDFWRKNPSETNNGTRSIMPSPAMAYIPHMAQTRGLFTDEVLRLEYFVQRRESIMKEYSENSEKFFSRLQEILESADENKEIFSNDLSTAIYLCDGSDLHIKILMQIIEQLLLKTKEETPYPHFSVIRNLNNLMQLLHHMNRPDLAVELLVNNERFPKLLEILPTLGLEVAVDLLERNSNHQEIIDIYSALMFRTNANRIPLRLKDVLISVVNSCYKLGTREAYDTALAIINFGVQPPTFRIRTHTPIALLALKYGDAAKALDILQPTLVANVKNYVTVYNMRIKALLDLDRIDESLVILKNLCEQSARSDRKYSVAKDVIEALANKIEEHNDSELKAKFSDFSEQLKTRNSLSADTLDEIMLSLMDKPLSKERPSDNRTRYNDDQDRHGKFDRRRSYNDRSRYGNRSNSY